MSWDQIPGWYGFEDTYRKAVALAQDGDTFVEVGVAFGRSVAHLSRMVIDSGKKVRIYAVDPWWDDWWHVPAQYPPHLERPTWGGEFAQMGRDLGGPFSAFCHLMRTHAPEELERINVLRCKSHEAAKIIGPCRMVMIDANHNYEEVAKDIAIWRPHMLPGGIFSGDDYSVADFPGVVQAVQENVPGYEVQGTTWRIFT